MSLLFRLIAAAHARGTHHRLALDGVARLAGSDAQRWQRLFLKHAPELLAGAKAPDDEFKDFQNHVLHPRDHFWGGAPDKARVWYGDLVESLARADWPAAAWCAGVLSHYVTDPVCPLHTAQSEAENAIHRALEWSVSTSYPALIEIAAADAARSINMPEGATWLEQLVSEAATEANQHYEKLIAHYDIHRGVVDPPSGLDVVAQRLVGDLLGLASALFAAVLDRAIAEAKVPAPEVSLTLDAVLATLRVPLNAVLKRMENARERQIVEAIYDELKATGKVEVNLPEAERVVRDRHAAEVLAKRVAPDLRARFPEKGRKAEVNDPERWARKKRIGARTIPQPGLARTPAPATPADDREVPINEPPRPAPRAADQVTPAGPVARFKGEPLEAPAEAPVTEAATEPVTAVPAREQETSVAVPSAGEPAGPAAEVARETTAASAPSRPTEAPSPQVTPAAEPARVLAAATRLLAAADVAARAVRAEPPAASPRIHLSAEQDIVDAPTIGPRMAERLKPLGLRTVGDLLLADPQHVAMKLGRTDVDAGVVRDWQDQARLVCLVPGLRGTHAQLLVGAGFRTAASIAECDADDLCARVLAFAAAPAGQRILRHGEAPDVARIRSWIEGARLARAA